MHYGPYGENMKLYLPANERLCLERLEKQIIPADYLRLEQNKLLTRKKYTIVKSRQIS